MRALKLATSTLALLTFVATSHAQQNFDGAKFFQELNNRGVNTKGIDGNKFLEEIANRGVNSTNPIDGQKFFEELSNRGVDTKGIDGHKFFEELANRGVAVPDMVKEKN